MRLLHKEEKLEMLDVTTREIEARERMKMNGGDTEKRKTFDINVEVHLIELNNNVYNSRLELE